MTTRAQFRESLEMLRVDVDALGLMAQLAVEGAMGALVGGDRSVADAGLEQDLVAASDLKRRDDVLDGCYRRLVEHLLDGTTTAPPAWSCTPMPRGETSNASPTTRSSSGSGSATW